MPVPPLFEMEGHARLDALISEVSGPFGVHGPGVRPALAPRDHPIDPVEVRAQVQRAEQRLAGQEPHGGGNLQQ